MRNRRSALLALVLAAGCAADPGDVTEAPTEEEIVLSLDGSYQATTPYATTVEELGAGSSAIETLVDLRDPSALLAAEIASETDLPAEIVAIIVDDAIGDRDQDIEQAIDGVLGETIEWDMETRLTISAGGIDDSAELVFTHYATRLLTTIDEEEREFELEKPTTSAMATADVKFDEPRVTLEEHTLVLEDLTMLGAFIESRLAPAIAPGTDNMYDALLEIVDCGDVGTELAQAACFSAVGKIADDVEDEIAKLQTFTVDMTLIGKADAKERTGDSRIDVITGNWFTRFHEDGVTVDAPLEATRY